MDQQHKKKGYFFVNTSNGSQACDPNTLFNKGRVRNCEYKYSDKTMDVQGTTWKDLLVNGIKIKNSGSTSSQKSLNADLTGDLNTK